MKHLDHNIYRLPRHANEVYENLDWAGWNNFLANGFLSFEEAKKFVIKLKLKSIKEWKEYCRSGKKPRNIPFTPDECYKDKGWKTWGDFLGTGYIQNRKRVYLPFKQARIFARKLNLKNVEEWKRYCITGRKPNNIPSDPYWIYKDEGWKGYGDFLGTGNVANFNKKFISFIQARNFVLELKLKNYKEWRGYCQSGKKPDNIPSNPYLIYKNKGWRDLGYFLGTGAIASFNQKYISFIQAKGFVKKLKLKNVKEWQEYCKLGKKPDNIPSCPQRSYKNKGWVTWGDFLGTNFVCLRNREYISYRKARSFVRKLKLGTHKKWQKYCKSGNRPDDIHSNPDRYYKNRGWITWGDFLGTGFVSCKDRKYRSFKESRSFIRKLKLKNCKE